MAAPELTAIIDGALEKNKWSFHALSVVSGSLSLDLVTSKEKLKIIAKLHFSRILRQLETYLDLID